MKKRKVYSWKRTIHNSIKSLHIHPELQRWKREHSPLLNITLHTSRTPQRRHPNHFFHIASHPSRHAAPRHQTRTPFNKTVQKQAHSATPVLYWKRNTCPREKGNRIKHMSRIRTRLHLHNTHIKKINIKSWGVRLPLFASFTAGQTCSSVLHYGVKNVITGRTNETEQMSCRKNVIILFITLLIDSYQNRNAKKIETSDFTSLYFT